MLSLDSYWDISYNDFNYSYVDVATDQYKFVTLSYDRLGLGDSSHGAPVNEIQASLEVALLAEITVILREGKYPGSMRPFKTVTHVGYALLNRLHCSNVLKIFLQPLLWLRPDLCPCQYHSYHF